MYEKAKSEIYSNVLRCDLAWDCTGVELYYRLQQATTQSSVPADGCE